MGRVHGIPHRDVLHVSRDDEVKAELEQAEAAFKEDLARAKEHAGWIRIALVIGLVSFLFGFILGHLEALRVAHS